MAIALETVVKQLEESGIVAAAKLAEFLPPRASPEDGEALLRELVHQNQLTKFQAQHFSANKYRALILGNYTILDKIGAGGMGQVFKAEHRRMHRVVAIKMLPPAMTKDVAALARFEREVTAAAKLNHANIVTAYDADRANGVHFLVMEYVEGSDLSALVKKNGPFPVNRAVDYILQAARGLAFAHAEGIVHRDIKPANLLLDKKGGIKILDMGLARIDMGGEAGPQDELTGTGAIMGTVDYMAPEQALDMKHADRRADIYSLGISLYYLLAGKAAYRGETALEKLMAHQNQPIPSLQHVQTTVPKQLDAVFKKMVAKKTDDRFQTMSEVIEALEGLGLVGSITSSRADAAGPLALSSADREKLAAKTTKNTLASLTDIVASEKSKHLFAKIVGGTFATIIAPILVFYLIKHLEKDSTTPNLPTATTSVATAAPVTVAANPTSQPEVLVASGGGPPNTPPSPSTALASSVPAMRTPKINATTLTIPAEALTFGGHRYLLVESPGTWPEAKAKAEAMGGHLATFTSQEEYAWVTSILPEKAHEGASGMAQRRTFIGGTRPTDSSHWTWVTGEPFDVSLLPSNKQEKQKGVFIVLVGQNRSDMPTDATTTYFLVEWDTLGPVAASVAP